MSKAPKLLLDSNILTDGLFSRFGLSKAVLALCASRTCQLVLSEYVRIEVERNILKKVRILTEDECEQLIDDYQGFLKLAKPIKIALAEESRVIQNRALIRHFADVPVVLAAIDSQCDWIITNNRGHFTNQVAKKINLKIGSPKEFFTEMVSSLNF
jgi:predicted nucleic acid-binding protein